MDAPVFPAGRDAELPTWLRDGASKPGSSHHDSAVIRGAGVGALVCAARLARGDAFAGRVTIAARRPVEDRRLVNGCTLRARTLDYIAAALGISRDSFVAALFGARAAAVATHEQAFAVGRETPPGGVALRPLTTWIEGSAERPLAYGLRNGHLVGRLVERAEALGVVFAGDVDASFDACRSVAAGDRPIVINGSHGAMADVPGAPQPERFVVASQMPMVRREDARLGAHEGFIGMHYRARGFDTGVYYPFHDPLTPRADFYGIFFRILRAPVAKEDEVAAIRRVLAGFTDALGLDAVDAAETQADALVPCLPWRDVPTHRPDYLDLFRTYSACTPVITGDGMTRGALAGWVAAEAILAGEDPVAVTNRSLRGWRRTNRAFALLMDRLAPAVLPLMRYGPKSVMARAGSAPDTWAGVA